MMTNDDGYLITPIFRFPRRFVRGSDTDNWQVILLSMYVHTLLICVPSSPPSKPLPPPEMDPGSSMDS